MSLRRGFSGLKKKLKHRLAGGRHEPGGIGAEASGESVDSIGSFPQPIGPEHHVIGKGEYDRPQSGKMADADKERVDSTDPALRSDDYGLAPVSEGQHDGKGVEAAIEGGGISEGELYLGSGVKHMIKSGPSQGGNSAGREKASRVDPLPSTPSMEPKSMQISCYFTHRF